MKNIIFDLGGVILKGKSSSVLDKLNTTKEEYNELINYFNNWEKLDIDECTIEEKFNSCNFSSTIENKYKDILLKYYELRNINIELLDLIKELKKNNKIYILSDNNRNASLYYKNLFKDLDGYIFSYEYKTIKKDGKLFDILLDKYNLNPKDCYFIDDSKENIEVAISKNINGHLYIDNETLYRYLKDNNIIGE